MRSPRYLNGGTLSPFPAEAKQVKQGVVSGRVFLVTEAGDIKPARFAEVYLLYDQRNFRQTDAEAKEERASSIWLHAETAALKRVIEMGAAHRSASDSVLCLGELVEFRRALIEVRQWGHDANAAQIISVTADEEGSFKMNAPPGQYVILAQGRAGFYDAFWHLDISDRVVVESGIETTIKLGSTDEACLRLNE